VALDGRHLKYFHATTNQRHAAAINDGTKQGCKWQGVGRKRDSIIWGQSSWEGIKKIKINEFTNDFFLSIYIIE
jgi:hypothetical protein